MSVSGAVVRFTTPRTHDEPDNLGNILIRIGLLTKEQLREAVQLHRTTPNLMLGEALVQLGFVEAEIVDHALAIQKAERASTSSGPGVMATLDRFLDDMTESVKRGSAALDALESVPLLPPHRR